MFRQIPILAVFFLSLPASHAQDIQRGKVKKVEPDKGVVVLTVDGKDVQVTVEKRTRIFGREDQPVEKALADIKIGSAVMFKAVDKGGVLYLVGLKEGAGKGPAAPLSKIDTSSLVPINDLGAAAYKGFKGGFYPDGKNERPAKHEAAGLALAKQVRPLDAAGKPSADGSIVLLSVGMSNTSQASDGFRKALARETGIHPRFLFVNGAQGGMTASAIQDPDDRRSGTRYWTTVDERLKSAGATREQVQAVWIKEADAGPKEGFPGYARKLEAELTKIVQLLPARFPNVKLVYLTSRTYGGYARTSLNPDPYAYESGFSVKWLIERQIKGEPTLNYDAKRGAVKAPWLSWGPYFWANGEKKRSDGFSYEPGDFAPDGTHLSASGQEKVGRLMVDFFRNDTTTCGWFLGAM